MNVALTRAKRALWVIGHADALSTNPDWGAFVRFAKESKAFVCVENIGEIFGEVIGAASSTAASGEGRREPRRGGAESESRGGRKGEHERPARRDERHDERPRNSWGLEGGSRPPGEQPEEQKDPLYQVFKPKYY